MTALFAQGHGEASGWCKQPDSLSLPRSALLLEGYPQRTQGVLLYGSFFRHSVSAAINLSVSLAAAVLGATDSGRRPRERGVRVSSHLAFTALERATGHNSC